MEPGIATYYKLGQDVVSGKFTETAVLTLQYNAVKTTDETYIKTWWFPKIPFLVDGGGWGHPLEEEKVTSHPTNNHQMVSGSSQKTPLNPSLFPKIRPESIEFANFHQKPIHSKT